MQLRVVRAQQDRLQALVLCHAVHAQQALFLEAKQPLVHNVVPGPFPSVVLRSVHFVLRILIVLLSVVRIAHNVCRARRVCL